MSIKERWKNLNQTEKLMIISVILLVILLSTRLTYTKTRIYDGFNYFFKDSTEVQK